VALTLSAEQAFIQRHSRKRPRLIACPERADWRLRAACRVSNVDFFPPDHLRGAARRRREAAAKAVCAGCPVRAVCLRYAIENNEPHGIWGGTTSRERARSLMSAGDVAGKETPTSKAQSQEARQLGHELRKKDCRRDIARLDDYMRKPECQM
jgi:WhiB family transcriptional regulator, redox-sensing transcriptional regulator